MPTPTPVGGVITITINGMLGARSFSPAATNVAVGQRVQWHNSDNVVHTATQDGGGLDTGPIAPGATSGPRTLGVAGTLDYHCSIHPTMVGRLLVH